MLKEEKIYSYEKFANFEKSAKSPPVEVIGAEVLLLIKGLSDGKNPLLELSVRPPRPVPKGSASNELFISSVFSNGSSVNKNN